MAPPHANCGQECLQCVLDWYRLGSSDVDEEEESSGQISAPLYPIVLESLSPSDLGTHVGETEFDDACSSYVVPEPKDGVPEYDDISDVNDGCRSGGKNVKDVDSAPESNSTIKFWNYTNRFLAKLEKRKRVDDGYTSSGKSPEKFEPLPETRSSFRMRHYEERFLARLNKSSK